MNLVRPQNPYEKRSSLEGKIKIRWGVLIFWILLLFGGVYFFTFSSFFNIQDEIIEGAKTVNSDEVKSIFDAYRARESNLFRFPVDEMANEIEGKFLQVEKAEVTRGVPKTIKIDITERDGFLIWQSQGKNYVVDKKGIAFKETSDVFSLPVVYDEQNKGVTLGEKILTNSFVKFINQINSDFEKKTKIKIKRITVVESTFELNVVTANGWKVIFDTTRGAESQIDALAKIYPLIKNKVKTYVDLRIKNWAYYK